MASSLKRPREDDPHQLLRELFKICRSDNLSLKPIQDIISRIPPNSMPIIIRQEYSYENRPFPDGYPSLPLHAACRNKNVDTEIVQALVTLWPEWASTFENEWDPDRSLPIHIAARYQSKDICKVLVDAYPQSVRIGSGNGGLPIHYACVGGHLDTVKYFIDLYPESIYARDRTGDLPIHWIDWEMDIVRYLLSRDPTFASMKNDSGCLPLHLACDCDASLEVIKFLFDFHPEALYATDEINGYTPLEILQLYSKNGPDKTAKVNFLESMLPLHCALQAKARLGTIKLLVKGNEEAVIVPGNHESYPIHIACEFCTVDVVEFLLKRPSWDEWFDLCDSDGNYPLHRACIGGNCNVVSYLFGRIERRDALFISETNKEEKLPLHLLIESDEVDRNSLAYQDALYLLIRAYPAALMNY